MGRPVITSSYISKTLDVNVVTANKASAIIFGDFSFYGVGDSVDNDIQTDASCRFENYQTVVRGVKRAGGNILLDEAFQFLAYRATD